LELSTLLHLINPEKKFQSNLKKNLLKLDPLEKISIKTVISIQKVSKLMLLQVQKRLFSKVVDIKTAMSKIQPGSTLLSGGFGTCGVANELIKEICSQKIGDLTVVSNNAGVENYGTG
jgi:hypothetical protein